METSMQLLPGEFFSVSILVDDVERHSDDYVVIYGDEVDPVTVLLESLAFHSTCLVNYAATEGGEQANLTCPSTDPCCPETACATQ